MFSVFQLCILLVPIGISAMQFSCLLAAYFDLIASKTTKTGIAMQNTFAETVVVC